MKQKFTKRLPAVRVTDHIYQGVKDGCLALGLSEADFMRAALEEYLTPGQPPEVIAVPINGKIKIVRDGEYIILPANLIDSLAQSS